MGVSIRRRAQGAAGLLALALYWVGIFAGPAAAQVLPTGEKVISGQINVARPTANNMVVNQNSAKGIIDWTTFSIGNGQSVVFRQPDANSATLNRVTSGAASTLAGTLQANGQVFLVNPAGILFSNTSQINVGAFIGSTLSLSNDDFLASRLAFQNAGGAGGIVNQGSITATGGGIALIAPQVDNQGRLIADGGGIGLAAGDKVTLNLAPDSPLTVKVDAAAVGARIANSGAIQADGGQVILTARDSSVLLGTVIDQSGTVRANSMRMQRGKIVLDGGTRGNVMVRGQIDARGVSNATASAGTTGTSGTSGTSGATSTTDPAATTTTTTAATTTAASTDPLPQGGDVTILGQNIGLLDGTRISTSGEGGGGAVLVGGNFQGRGPLPNASNVAAERDVVIDASATVKGNGGQVVLWADEYTRSSTTIRSLGGPEGGDGGQGEVSGKVSVGYDGVFVADAPKGTAGSLLLDPSYLCIGDAAYSNCNSTTATSKDSGGFICNLGPPFCDLAVSFSSINVDQNVRLYATEKIDMVGNLNLNQRVDPAKYLTFDAPYVAMLYGTGAAGSLTTAGGSVAFVTSDSILSSAAAGIRLGSISLANRGTLVIDNGLVVPTASDRFQAQQEPDTKITAIGALIKRGNGTLVLSEQNSFSGGVTVEKGILSVSAPGVLPSGVPLTVGALGVVQLNAPVTVSSLDGAAGSVIAAASSSTPQDLNIATSPNGNVGTFNGILQGLNVTVNGGGAQNFAMSPRGSNLTVANASVGLTLVPQPFLNGSAVAPSALPLTVSTAGVVDLQNANLLTNGVNLNGGSIGNGALKTESSSSLITARAGTLGASLLGPGSFQKIGSDTVLLTSSSSNLFTGAAVVKEGTLAMSGTASLPRLEVASGAELDLRGLTSDTPITVDSGGLLRAQTGTSTLANVTNLSNAIQVDDGASLTLSKVTFGPTTNPVSLRGRPNASGGYFTGGQLILATNEPITLASSNLTSLGVTTTSGDILQSGPVAVNGPAAFLATGSGAAINFNRTDNAFAGAVTLQATNVSLGNGIDTLLGNVDAGGNFAVLANGTIGQASGTRLAVTGNSTVWAVNPATFASPKDITLDSAQNVFTGTLQGIGANVTVAAASVLNLTQLNASGNLNLSSTATAPAAITEATTGRVVAGGRTVLSTPNGGVKLSGTNNQFVDRIGFAGSDLILNNSVDTILGDIRATSLAVTTGPATVPASITRGISQAKNTAVVVSGNTTLNAGSDAVSLDNVGNAFTGTVSATGGNVTLASDQALTLHAINAGGSFAATARGGALNQLSGGSLAVTGSSTFSAASDINLFEQAGNVLTGPVQLATTTGSATVRAASALTLTGADIAGNLALWTLGQPITQTDGLVVGGALDVKSLSPGPTGFVGDINLTKGNNRIGGTVTALGQNVSLTAESLKADVAASKDVTLTSFTGALSARLAGNSFGDINSASLVSATGLSVSGAVAGTVSTRADFGATTLGASPTAGLSAGNLSVTAYGDVGQLGPVTVATSAEFLAARVNTAFNLTDAGNAFAGPVRFGEVPVAVGATPINWLGDIRFTNSGSATSLTLPGTIRDLTLKLSDFTAGDQHITRNLAIATTQDINQASGTALTVDGTTNLASASGDIVLANAANRFRGAVTLAGADVQLTGTGNLLLGNVDAQTLAVRANADGSTGDIVQDSGTRVVVPGAASFTAGTDRAITLTSATNSFDSPVALTGGATAITAAGGLDLNAVSTGDLTVRANLGGSNGIVRFSNGATVRGNLDVASNGGSITQPGGATQGMTVQGNAQFDARGASGPFSSVILASTDNDFQGLVRAKAPNTVRIYDVNDLRVAGLEAMIGDLQATGNVRFDASTLDPAGSRFGLLQVISAAGAISQAEAAPLTVLGSTFAFPPFQNMRLAAGNGITLTSSANQFDVPIAINSTGPASLVSVGGMTLSELNTRTLSVTAQGGDLALGRGTITGDLTATANKAGAAITQDTSGTLAVTGVANIQAGPASATLPSGRITLDQANAFGGDVRLAGGSTVFRMDNPGTNAQAVELDVRGTAVVRDVSTSAPSLTVRGRVRSEQIGSVTTPGTLQVEKTAGDLTLGTLGVAQDATLTGIAGLNQTGVVTVGGTLRLNAPVAATASFRNIDLSTQANDFTQPVVFNAGRFGDVALRNVHEGVGVDLTRVTGGFDDLRLQLANVNQDLGGWAVGGNLDLDVGAGSASQSAALNVTGTSRIVAGSVLLNNASNDFGGALSLTTADAAVRDRNALTLGTLNVRDLAATSAGALEAGTGAVRNLTLVTTGGNLTQNTSGGLQVTGTIDVNTAAPLALGTAVLEAAGNQFIGDVKVTAGLTRIAAERLNFGALDVSSLTAQSRSGSVRFNDATRANGFINVTSATSIGQNDGSLGPATPAAITAGGVRLTATGDVVLDNPYNALAGLQLAGRDVTVANYLNVAPPPTGVFVNAISARNLTLTTQSALTQVVGTNNAITTTGAVSIASNGAAVTLDNQANDFKGTVDLSTGNTSISDRNGIALNNLATGSLLVRANRDPGTSGSVNLGAGSIGGTLTANVGAGAITQAGALNVGGNTTLQGAAITLDSQSNVFGGTVALADGAAVIVARDNLNLAGLTNLTSLDATARNGSVNFGGGGTVVGDLSARASAGSVTEAAALSVGGATSVRAGPNGSIALTQANRFNGAVTLSGASAAALTNAAPLMATFATTGPTTLTTTGAGNGMTVSGTVTDGAAASGTLSLASAGAVALGTTRVGSTLDVNAAGAVTQSGVLTVPGALTVIATGSNVDVNLAGAANVIGGAIEVGTQGAGTLRDVALRNTDAAAAFTLAAPNSRNLTLIADNTSIDLAARDVGGNLVLRAGGDLGQSGAVRVTGTSSLVASNGAITFNNSNNVFGGAVSVTGRATEVLSGTALTLGTVSVDSLTATTGGALDLGSGTVRGELSASSGNAALTQTGSLTVAGLATLNAGSGAITLTDANNRFGNVVLTGGSAQLTNHQGLTAALNTAGDASVTVASATPAALTVGGVVGGSLTANATGAVGFNDTSVAGNLNAGASVVITQTGTLQVAGNATFSATGSNVDLALGSAPNDIAGTLRVNTAGGTLRDVSVRDINANAQFDIANPVRNLGVRADQVANLELGTNLGINGVSNNLTLTSGGALGQAVGTTLRVPGTTTLTGTTIRFAESGNDFTGAVTVTGGDTTLVDRNALTLGTLAVGALDVSSAGALNLGRGTVGGALAARSANNAITQGGALAVSGASNVNAGTGNVTLDQSGNTLAGAVTVTGNTVTLANARDLDVALNLTGVTARATTTTTQGGNVRIGVALDPATTSATLTSNAAGDTTLAAIDARTVLDISSGGRITQDTALALDNNASFKGASITLENTQNDFRGTVNLSGGNAILVDRSALTVGSVALTGLDINTTGNLNLGQGTVSGTLGARSGNGAITQGGALTVSGAATIDAGQGDATLASLNRFTGTVGISGRAVTLTNVTGLNATVNASDAASVTVQGTRSDTLTLTGSAGNGLTLQGSGAVALGATQVTGDLGIGASGSVTQSGAVGVTGNTTLNVAGTPASPANVALAGAANSFAGSVTVGGSNLNDVAVRTTSAGTTFAINAPVRDLTLVSDNGSLILGNNATVNTIGRNLSLTASGAGGRVGQTTAVTVNGDASFTGATIAMSDTANSFRGTVNLAGGANTAASVGAGGALTLGSVAVGNLAVDANGALNLGSGSVSGALTAVSRGGAVTQAGALAVAGNADIAAGTGNVTLTNAANAFAGTVTVSGQTLDITNARSLDARLTPIGDARATVSAGDLSVSAQRAVGAAGTATLTTRVAGNTTLGTIGTTGSGLNLDATTGGTLGQSQTLALDGTATLRAATINLNDAGNDFRNTVNVAGGRAILADGNDLTLGRVDVTGLEVANRGVLNLGSGTVAGNLSAVSGNGDISQAGALAVTGLTGLDAGSGNVALTNAGNRLAGAVTVGGANADLRNATSLALTANTTGNVGVQVAATRSETLSLSGAVGGNLSAQGSGAVALVTTRVGGNLAVIGNGNLSQSGALDVAGTSALTVNGTPDTAANVALAGAANNFAGVVSVGGTYVGDVAVRNINANAGFNIVVPVRDLTLQADNAGLTLGGGTMLPATARNLNLTAGGAIDQTSAVTVTGTATLNAPVIALDTAGNDFRGTLNLTGGTARIADANALTLGAVNVTALDVASSGALNLGSGTVAGALAARSNGGAVTQGGALAVTGATTVDAGAGNVTLTQATNAFSGPVTLSGARADIVNARSLDATLNVANAGNVTVGSGNLAVAGRNTGTGVATLTTNATGNTLLGRLDGLNLDINTSGTLTQSAALTTTGAARFNAGSTTTLDNAGNDFGGAVTLAGGRTVIVDQNALNLARVDVTSLDVRTGGDLNLGSGAANGTGNVTVNGAFNASSGNGNITQGGALLVTGATNLDAGTGNVTLTQTANRLQSGVTVLGGDARIVNGGALNATLGVTGSADLQVAGTRSDTLTVAGTTGRGLTATSSGALALGTTQVGGNATLTAGGNVSQTGTLAVAGSLDIVGNGNAVAPVNVTLANANELVGQVRVSGSGVNDVSLRTTGANADFVVATPVRDLTLQAENANLTLGGSTGLQSVGRNLVVSGRSIAQSSAVTVNGNATLNGQSVVLDDAGNDFKGTVTASGGDISVTDRNALTLGTLNATNLSVNSTGALNLGNGSVRGTLNVASNGGAITQTDALAVSGVAQVDAGAGNVSLTQAGNAFAGAVTLTGANADIANARSLDATFNVANGASATVGSGNLTVAGRNTGSGVATLTTNTTGNTTLGSLAGLTLDINTTGSLTQTAALVTSGPARFNAGSTATLDNTGNDFGGPVNLAGGRTVIVDQNALNLARVDVASLEVRTAGDLNLGSGAANNTGNVTVAGAFNANSGNGNITQGGALLVTGSSSIDAGTGNVTLAQTGNRLQGAVAVLANDARIVNGAALNVTLGVTGTASVQVAGTRSDTLTVAGTAGSGLTANSSGALALGTTRVGGNATLTSGGNVTQSGTLGVAGTLDILGNGTVVTPVNVTLANANELAGQVRVGGSSVNDVNLRSTSANVDFAVATPVRDLTLQADNASLTLGGSSGLQSVGRNLVLTAGGSIGQSSAVTVKGAATLNAQGIALTDVANDFKGTVNVNGGAVSLTDANALALGTVNATSLAANSTGALNLGNGTVNGALAARSNGGAVTQGGTLNVAGTTAVDAAGGNITLTQAGNAFTGAVDLAGADVRVVNGRALDVRFTGNGGTLEATTKSGDLSVRAQLAAAAPAGRLVTNSAGNTTLGALDARLSLDATATGNIGQSATLSLDGPARFAAANTNLSDPDNDLRGVVTLASGNVNLAARGALQLGAVSVQQLEVSAANGLDLGSGSVQNNLRATSFNAPVTQTGALAVGGASVIAAGSGDVTLDQAGNRFTGPVTLTAGTARLVNRQGLAVTLDVDGATDVRVSGTSVDALALAGRVGGDLNVASSGAGRLGATSVGGNLAVATNADLTQSDVVNVAGATTLNAVSRSGTAANVVLDRANTFAGTVTITGRGVGDVNLRNVADGARFDIATSVRDLTLTADAGNLVAGNDFTTSGIGRNLALTAGNAIGQTTALVVPGTASFTARSVTLGDAGNDFGGTVNVASGAVQIADANALSLGTVDADRLAVSANGALRLGTGAVRGDVSVASNGGAVTQGGALAVGGALDVAAGAGDITLASAGNRVAGRATLSGQNVRIVTTGNLDVAFDATGQVRASTTDNGNLVVAGRAGSTLTTESTGTTSLGALTTGGAVAVTSAGKVTQSAALTVPGTLGLRASGQNVEIALDTQPNAIAGTITVDATSTGSLGRVAIRNTDANATLAINAPVASLGVAFDNAAVSLPALTVAGDFALSSSIGISQTGAWTLAGAARFDAGRGALTLTQAGNNFTGPVTASAGTTAIATTGPLAIVLDTTGTSLTSGGALTASGRVAGDLQAKSGATASLGATSVAGALDLTGRGAIAQTGVLSVAGATRITAEGGATDVQLASAANDLAGPVSVNANGLGTLGNVALRSTNAATRFTIGGATRDLTLIADRAPVALGTAGAGQVVDGQLNVQAGGAITQSGAVSVAGTASLDAGTSDVRLADAANRFGGAVTVRGANATVAAADILDASVSATRAADVRSTGSLALAGSVGGDLAATAGTSTSLGTLTVGGRLAQSASGNITQTGDVQVAGAASIDAGSGRVALDRAGNDFGAAVAARGAAIALADANDLQASIATPGAARLVAGGSLRMDGNSAGLTARAGGAARFAGTQVDGSLDVRAGTGVGQSAALTVTGPSTLTVDTGALVLDRADNVFGGPVTASAQRIALTTSTALAAKVQSTGEVGLVSGATLGVSGTAATLDAQGTGAVSFGTTTVAGRLNARSATGGITTQPGETVTAGEIVLAVPSSTFIGSPVDAGAGAFSAGSVRVDSALAAFLKSSNGVIPALGQGPDVLCLLLDGVGCVFTAPALQAVQSGHEASAPAGRWLAGDQAGILFRQPERAPFVLPGTVGRSVMVEPCRMAAGVELDNRGGVFLVSACN